MNFDFKKMTQEQAEEIAYNWHYEDEYAFYNMEEDKEDLAEFLDTKKRGDSMFVVTNDNEVIGFFSFYPMANNTIDVGLGMRPDLTGIGYGLEFLKSGIEFVNIMYSPKTIVLSVATFNKRAIKMYRKFGFKEIDTFVQSTNGGHYEFTKMQYYNIT